MDCPRELIIFIKEYLGNRKCYIELNSLTSNVFNIEKGVPQGSCLGPILFLLYHCPLPSASHVHLYADDLALIITASPWWPGAAFTGNMQSLGQFALNHLQTYVAVWKQPINSQKTEWQWIHRRVVIPSLSFTINRLPIQRTTLARYLGTYVDDKLSFHQHCNKMLQKNTNQFRHIKISHSITHLFVQSPSFGS